MENQSNPKDDIIKGRSIPEYIKQIGAFGILLTSFTVGFAIATTFWSSSLSVLNSQLSVTRESYNKVNEELMQVKSDYLTYRSTTNKVDSTVSKIDSKSKATHKDSLNVTNQIEVFSINTEFSKSFFNGDLIISLIATPFEGDPLRHKVLANISSPSGKVVKIEKEDIGNVITYTGKNTYKITILEAETFSAKFQVLKTSK